MRFLPTLLVLFLNSFFFSACQSTDELDALGDKQLPTAASYLALGDSYTIGEGLTTTNERWPMHLSQQLSQASIEVGEPLVIAKTGWTTGDLLKHLRSISMPNDYAMVTLQIGVNNQYQGRSLEEFRTEFKTLLTISTNLAQKNPKNVLVLTIPDWGVTPSANGRDRVQISAQIKAFNDVIKAEAAKLTIAVGEVNDLSLLVTQTPALLAPDQLHYSGSMYQQWAQRVLPLAKTILLD